MDPHGKVAGLWIRIQTTKITRKTSVVLKLIQSNGEQKELHYSAELRSMSAHVESVSAAW